MGHALLIYLVTAPASDVHGRVFEQMALLEVLAGEHRPEAALELLVQGTT